MTVSGGGSGQGRSGRKEAEGLPGRKVYIPSTVAHISRYVIGWMLLVILPNVVEVRKILPQMFTGLMILPHSDYNRFQCKVYCCSPWPYFKVSCL
jgi:hypothetical protein